MTIQAKLRYLRMSPRKVRLVVDVIRGLSVREAETRLQFMPKVAAAVVLKLLRSAMANATHNHHLDLDTLRVSHVTVDGGPTLKRFRPRAMGRAAEIRKRTSHVLLSLSSEPAVAKKPKAVRTKRRAANPRTTKKIASPVG